VNQIRSVIWDWNGTLLNDVSVSLNSVNRLLAVRKLETITLSCYLDVFTFPVREYYEKIGFDFSNESFDIIAHQFIEIYNEAVRECGLHNEAVLVLDYIKNFGLKQYILSAMEQGLLEETVKYNNISSFFEGLYGLDNKYAVSKIDIGISLVGKYNLQPQQTLLIGDTVHDFEVAAAIGCQCILVANGHQSKYRLESTGATVIESLLELISCNLLDSGRFPDNKDS
jgi:phosphoglycolate phosphatase